MAIKKKSRNTKSNPSVSTETGAGVVLVGTYKGDQLSRWHGWYNYPITSEDRIDAAEAAKINELWLFRGTKGRKTFRAQFVGVKTRDELVRDYGYPAEGRPHGSRYLLFRTALRYGRGGADGKRVVVRTKDFAKRSPEIARRLKRFLESSERRDSDLADLLPSAVANLRPEQLRVCEEAVQLDLLSLMQEPHRGTPTPFPFVLPARKSLKTVLTEDMPLVTEPFTHVDCFSGVGGFCTGLHAAGFTTNVAIEKVSSCVETYAANHPDVHTIHNDIRNVAAEDVLPYCPPGGIDLVTSGMPCETFSTAGNTSCSFYDDRQFLFREGIRMATIVNAKFLLFENVPGITSKTVSKGDKTLIVDVLKDEMSKAGYRNFIEVVLDATRFGVPQRRKRFFILGTRLPNVRLRRPISRLNRTFTVRDALEGLPPVVPNSWQEGREYSPSSGEYASILRDNGFWHMGDGMTDHITYHMPMKHRPATLERFGLLAPGESIRDLFGKFAGRELESLQARHVVPKKLFIKRNYRLPFNSPSPTVTSHCLDEFVHPTENRALTVRECARLQSFPDSYDFAGGPYIVPHINREVQDKYEQIGDAVPPLLAFAWGKAIAEMLLEVKT